MATHRFVIEGTEYEVQVGPRSGNTVAVSVNGKAYTVELKGSAVHPVAPPSSAPAPTPPSTPMVSPPTAPVTGAGPGEVRAPIPGVVLSVAVRPGQNVAAGAILLVIEAMKMENEIFAPIEGVVASVSVRPQQDVRQGDLLVTIKAG